MIDPLGGGALTSALAGLNGSFTGLTIGDAYDQYITGQYPTDDGPTIGFADYTSDKPSISGDTNGTISTGDGNTPEDAWNDYVETTDTTVSTVTGGVVSGSKVNTFVYSLMEDNDNVVKAVAPVAVALDAAIVALGQAAGVSIKVAELDIETKDTLANALAGVGGIVYDKAKGLVTAWKDEWGRILFPKKAFDALYNVVKDWGGGDTKTSDLIPVGVRVVQGVNVFASNSMTLTREIEVINGIGWVATTATNPQPDSAGHYSANFYAASSERAISYSVNGAINTTNGVSFTHDGRTVYWVNPFGGPGVEILPHGTPPQILPANMTNAAAWTAIYGEGGSEYPDGTSESEATKYTPNTIPVVGDLATSYDAETGDLGTEPLVPINIPENPYDSIGSTVDPTTPTDDENAGVITPGIPGYVPDPADPSAQPKEENVPIPLPIPDTKPSNPDIPLVNTSVVDSTLIDELVEELANTVDPQPPKSSGVIPIPQLPGITDPETGDRTFPSIIPESGPGFIHVYNPTPAEFVAFGTWLWVTYADATIDKILNNPFDGVIGAHEFYATPNRGGRDNIRSAFLTCPTTADLVPNRYSEIDCGTVIVPEFYGNYLDYSPYSQAYIYLPFIGINEVSIDDIVGHAVNIRYRVDSYSGSCIAMIFVAKDGYQNLCYQFAGNCAVDVPMAGGSQAAIKAGMMQAEAYARAAQASSLGHLFGGIGSALMGSLGGAISGISGIIGDYANAQAGVEAARVANKSTVQHSGQFGASHGAMGEKVPFIIIRNPIQVKVVNYNQDYGFPAHKRVIIGGCTGYLRVREVNVISAHATDDEKAQIEALLKNGVYIS